MTSAPWGLSHYLKQKYSFFLTKKLILIGSKYWKLTSESVADGYPRSISEDWPGLPDDIDAAFTWQESGATYFFKGNF